MTAVDDLREPGSCPTCGQTLSCGETMGRRAKARAIALAETRDAFEIACEKPVMRLPDARWWFVAFCTWIVILSVGAHLMGWEL